MNWTRLLIGLLAGCSKRPDAPEALAELEQQAFTRAKSVDGRLHLQTEVQRWHLADGPYVDLVAAVHLGQSDYYSRLNGLLSKPDRVLFEMVGGEQFTTHRTKPQGGPEALAPAPLELAPTQVKPASSQRPTSTDWLNRIYHQVAQALHLEHQLDWIDYLQGHFVHADLRFDEFKAAQKTRKESLLKFLWKKNREQASPSESSFRRRPWLALKAGLSPKPDAIRDELILKLCSAELSLSQEKEPSLIISERNQRCLEILEQELAAGHRHLAIFFGAAHMPAFVDFLKSRGFKLEDSLWLNAW